MLSRVLALWSILSHFPHQDLNFRKSTPPSPLFHPLIACFHPINHIHPPPSKTFLYLGTDQSVFSRCVTLHLLLSSPFDLSLARDHYNFTSNMHSTDASEPHFTVPAFLNVHRINSFPSERIGTLVVYPHATVRLNRESQVSISRGDAIFVNLKLIPETSTHLCCKHHCMSSCEGTLDRFTLVSVSPRQDVPLDIIFGHRASLQPGRCTS